METSSNVILRVLFQHQKYICQHDVFTFTQAWFGVRFTALENTMRQSTAYTYCKYSTGCLNLAFTNGKEKLGIIMCATIIPFM